MEKIKSDWKKIMEDGSDAAVSYLVQAVKAIDEKFGDGYAKQHPELVGAFMKAAATDSQGIQIAKAIQELAEELSKANSEIASQLFNVYEQLRLKL